VEKLLKEKRYDLNKVYLSWNYSEIIRLFWFLLNPLSCSLFLASWVFFKAYNDSLIEVYLWYALTLLFSGVFTGIMN
jgi:hypothetical protein